MRVFSQATPDKFMNKAEIQFRQLSRICAGYLNKASQGRLTPNSLTWASLILHLPVAWLIIEGYLWPAGVGLLFAASLDGLDGALARLQGTASNFGIWLDASADRLKEIIIFTGLAYYLTTINSEAYLIGLCILVLGLSILISYVKAKAEAVLATIKHFKGSNLNRIIGGGVLAYGLRVIIVSLMLISQLFPIGLGLLALGALITLIQRTLTFKTHLAKQKKK